MVVVLAALVALVVGMRVRYPGQAPTALPAGDCDPELWRHVYDPKRLRVVEACTAVEGQVTRVHRAKDGDVHIELDPDHKSVLNLMNLLHVDGNLVVEVICEHAPDEAEAKDACADHVPRVTVPSLGDRVRVTGAYVTDLHNRWNEIHPVTRIEVLH